MGLFDLPAPALAWIDHAMDAALPPLARLTLWAAVGALVSMELYRRISPQRRLRDLRAEIRAARQRLYAYDGDFAGARPLLGRMIGLSLTQIGLVAPATLGASLPLVVLVVWVSTAYGYAYPPTGTPVDVRIDRPEYRGRFVESTPYLPPRVVVVDAEGRPAVEPLVPAPAPVIHKRRWWNALIGNPAGYLPDDAPVGRVAIGLPKQELIPFGPPWLRGWEASFFAALALVSLVLKVNRQIV